MTRNCKKYLPKTKADPTFTRQPMEPEKQAMSTVHDERVSSSAKRIDKKITNKAVNSGAAQTSVLPQERRAGGYSPRKSQGKNLQKRSLQP
jgi:hypothetical protein